MRSAIVLGHLRRRFARFKLCAHLLQARSKRVNLLLLRVNLATCFEKFVEQHRVDLLIADRFGLAVCIASHQIGIHLGHFLSDQSKGERLRRVVLLVIAEADRLERVEHFTGFLHRLNIVFIPAGRYVTAPKPAAAGYRDRIGVGPNNRLHIGVDVADKAAVAHVRPSSADTNNVTGRGDTVSSVSAQRRVEVAASAISERIVTDSRVAITGDIVPERKITSGRVVDALCVVNERVSAVGRVVEANRVVKECLKAVGRVVFTLCIAKEGSSAIGCIEAAGGVARKRIDPDGGVVLALGIG